MPVTDSGIGSVSRYKQRLQAWTKLSASIVYATALIQTFGLNAGSLEGSAQALVFSDSSCSRVRLSECGPHEKRYKREFNDSVSDQT